MASGPSQPKPQIIEDDMVPPGTMYALNFNSIKVAPIAPEVSAKSLLDTLKWWYEPAIEDSAPTFGDYAKDHPNPDAREWDHDRRLRGQYE